MIDALGQYKILELAGAGTLGEVYRARDNRVGRTVAITVVTDQIALNPGLREEFLRQARAAAALSHPNIVTLNEVGDDDDGGLYLIYEFVEGQTLKTIIAGRPINPRRAVDLAGQIAEAIVFRVDCSRVGAGRGCDGGMVVFQVRLRISASCAVKADRGSTSVIPACRAALIVSVSTCET